MERFVPSHGRRKRRPADASWDAFFGDEPRSQHSPDTEKRLMSLADVGLSVRIVNTLEKHDIFQVGQLALRTAEELLAIENFGESTLSECARCLRALGVSHPDWNSECYRVKRLLKKKTLDVGSVPTTRRKRKRKTDSG